MILLALQPEVILEAASGSTLNVAHPVHGKTVLRDIDAGVSTALQALPVNALPVRELEARAIEALPSADLTRLRHEIGRFARWGLVRFRLAVAGRQIAEAALTSDLAPLTLAVPGPLPLAAQDMLLLSRFAYLRRVGAEVVIESAASYSRVSLTEAAVAAALPMLAQPIAVAEVCEALACSPEVTREFLAMLVAAGIAGVSGRLVEETDPQAAQREFHDVLLHRHSRRGLTDERLGIVFPFTERFPPQPAVKPVEASGPPPIPLPRPDLDQLARTDPPLAVVMERRRSTRTFGATPLSIGQLGEFLFRVARVRTAQPADPEAGIPYEVTDRPCPSGGGGHELELYLSVRSCAGLPPGIYHYEPALHALTLVTAEPKLVVGMVNEAHWSLGRESVPHVLITLASRFNRLAWKYRGISYTLTLKNTGVLMEAMYLAATAMDLGVCALGGGNSAMFSAATGLDPLAESSVGEVVLGTLPEGGR